MMECSVMPVKVIKRTLTPEGIRINNIASQELQTDLVAKHLNEFYNMSSLPTGYAILSSELCRKGGPTSRDRFNSIDNYLLLGFLVAMPSQNVLLLVR